MKIVGDCDSPPTPGRQDPSVVQWLMMVLAAEPVFGPMAPVGTAHKLFGGRMSLEWSLWRDT